MKTNCFHAACVGALALAGSMSVDAALIGRLPDAFGGYQAIFDTDRNITWLADANLAASDTFGVSGITATGYMTWSTAESWIGAMNAANYLGYNDWRLPDTLQPDPSCSNQSGGSSTGYNCTGSELGHLYYDELGGQAATDITTTHNANYELFTNINPDVYWSGTETTPGSDLAWAFLFSVGHQFAPLKSNSLFAWAVRTGDVSPVPISGAAWLFGSGLLGLIAAARRKT